LQLLIRTIPDFPRLGILFRDVTTLMRALPPVSPCWRSGRKVRGFINGAAQWRRGPFASLWLTG
jgi:hypothetical protein